MYLNGKNCYNVINGGGGGGGNLQQMTKLTEDL